MLGRAHVEMQLVAVKVVARGLGYVVPSVISSTSPLSPKHLINPISKRLLALSTREGTMRNLRTGQERGKWENRGVLLPDA
jgi:hypothetical protein